MGSSDRWWLQALEGTRPLLVEVQALVTPSNGGHGRRTAVGVDSGRVAILLAVLEKKAQLDITGCDVFVNVAGGLRLDEPAVDLAIAAALASSHIDRPVPADTVVLVSLVWAVRFVLWSARPPVWPKRSSLVSTVSYSEGNAAEATAQDGVTLHGVDNIIKLLDVLF